MLTLFFSQLEYKIIEFFKKFENHKIYQIYQKSISVNLIFYRYELLNFINVVLDFLKFYYFFRVKFFIKYFFQIK